MLRKALVPIVAAVALFSFSGSGLSAVSVQQGQTLTANPGTWTGTPPIAFAYQWKRCDTTGASCADIAAASNVSYTVAVADVGSTLRVAVTGSNTAGASTAVSDQTSIVAGIPPVNTGLPTIGVTSAFKADLFRFTNW